MGRIEQTDRYNWKHSLLATLLASGHSLLAIINRYCVPVRQWTWLYQALSVVSMNKIALWINVCAHDWTTKRAIIASDETRVLIPLCRTTSSFTKTAHAVKQWIHLAHSLGFWVSKLIKQFSYFKYQQIHPVQIRENMTDRANVITI